MNIQQSLKDFFDYLNDYDDEMLFQLTSSNVEDFGISSIVESSSQDFFGDHCQFEYGASRFCIIPDNKNFIFKCSFAGTSTDFSYNPKSFSQQEIEEEKNRIYQFYPVSSDCEFEDGSGFIQYIEPFSGCIFQEESWSNYCEVEEAIYEYIEQYHQNLIPIFSKIEKVGTFYDIPVYIQPKVTKIVNENYNYHPCNEKDSAFLNQYINSHYTNGTVRRLSENWLSSVIELYGRAVVIELLDFINENLSDLHSSNYGWIDDKPVIFDYAGYNE